MDRLKEAIRQIEAVRDRDITEGAKYWDADKKIISAHHRSKAFGLNDALIILSDVLELNTRPSQMTIEEAEANS